MKETITQLREAIEGLLNTDMAGIDWERKPLPEKWSKKEIIGHLIDSAQINLQRFIRCTYEENFKLIYEQVESVQVNRYQQTSIADLLSLWELLNRQIMRVLEDYPADRLQARCDNSKKEVKLHTVEWLTQDYVDHLVHHLNQVYTH
jgi:hypothetical protein